MKEKEPLDTDKMAELVPKYAEELVLLILSKGNSKEIHASYIAAMADVVTLMACKMCGYEMAQEIVPMAIAHGFKLAFDLKKEGRMPD